MKQITSGETWKGADRAFCEPFASSVRDPLGDPQTLLKGGHVQARNAALVVLAAALTFASAAGSTSTAPKQRVAITSKAGVDHFTLVALRPGPLGYDSGGVDWCCYSSHYLNRGAQRVLVNDPRATLTGKQGTLVLRFRIEWLDAGNAYTIGVSTWKVVKGTGAYAGVSGGGRGASSWLPRGPVSFLAEGFLISK